jgi:hypothetical protein
MRERINQDVVVLVDYVSPVGPHDDMVVGLFVAYGEPDVLAPEKMHTTISVGQLKYFGRPCTEHEPKDQGDL